MRMGGPGLGVRGPSESGLAGSGDARTCGRTAKQR